MYVINVEVIEMKNIITYFYFKNVNMVQHNIWNFDKLLHGLHGQPLLKSLAQLQINLQELFFSAILI